MFQNLMFARSDTRTRGSLRAHNKALSEEAVRCVKSIRAIDWVFRQDLKPCVENEDRLRRKKRNSDPGTHGSLGATLSEQEMRKAIKFWKGWEK